MVIAGMHVYAIFGILFAAALFIIPAYADVSVTDSSGFYGKDGTYYVIGVIKNSGEYDSLVTAVVQVEYAGVVTEKTAMMHNIKPGGEMPFKIPIYDAKGEIPKILEARASHIRGISSAASVEVIYDETLIVHPDGHVAGRIVNSGTEPVKHAKLVAVAHGKNHEMLDVVSNAQPITYMMPGEIRDFAMYSDAAVSENVWYYSCFGLGDLSAIPLNVQRSGKTFPMRYDSGLLLAYPEFNADNTNLTITIVGGWPLHDSINIEFPIYDNDEKFNVTIDDKPINFIQSIDEFGSWHVAFNVKPQTSGILVIEGFNPDATYDAIPQHVREWAKMWAAEQINATEFASGISYLVGEYGNALYVPDWVRNNAGWWSAGFITDEEFVAALKYLASSGILHSN